MQNEIWKPVRGFEGAYEVSNLGRVRSLPRIVRYFEIYRFVRGGIIAGTLVGPGLKYLKVHMGDRHHAVHKLVLEAFVGLRPAGMVACHLDDNPENNRLDNLEWKTQAENVRDCIARGRRKRRFRNGTEAEKAMVRSSRLSLDMLSQLTGFHPVTLSRWRNFR